jgi:hypothetical protein
MAAINSYYDVNIYRNKNINPKSLVLNKNTLATQKNKKNEVSFQGFHLNLPKAWLSKPWDAAFRKETPNLLDKVLYVDNFLYRGPVPGLTGLEKLRNLKNINIIIDLKIHSGKYREKLREKAESLGVEYYNIPINSFKGPQKEQEEKFFKIVDDAKKRGKNAYVHCLHGADRTGTMIALYRMKRQGWTFLKAFNEMWIEGHERHYKLFPNFEKYLLASSQNKLEIVA